jgi:hypothetical protein
VLAARHQAQIAGDQLMPGRERRSPADRFIGMKIRERRMTLGLTMRQFRELVGKTYQQVYKYERAPAASSPEHADRFHDEFRWDTGRRAKGCDQ